MSKPRSPLRGALAVCIAVVRAPFWLARVFLIAVMTISAPLIEDPPPRNLPTQVEKRRS